MKRRTIYDELYRMQKEMDSLFQPFFERHPLFADNTPLIEQKSGEKKALYRRPVTEFMEKDDKVLVELEMPGVDKKDIDINVTDEAVEIKAEQSFEKTDEKQDFIQRRYNGFYKCFGLPDNVDASNAHAEFNNGILKIMVPKKQIEQPKTKKLEIK